MGLISWFGQFGPENTGRLPFWWDMGLVVVFSLAIYYWAASSGMPRRKVRQAVQNVELEASVELPTSLA